MMRVVCMMRRAMSDTRRTYEALFVVVVFPFLFPHPRWIDYCALAVFKVYEVLCLLWVRCFGIFFVPVRRRLDTAIV